jgi:hypothetical protein
MRRRFALRASRENARLGFAVRRTTMHRYVFAAGSLLVFSLTFLAGSPAVAITAKQKMETCKFGADNQKLTGKDRALFLKRCMSNKNDPRGPAVGTPGAPAAPNG